MSSCNCCFLTCIQVSQETGQVVWYSYLSEFSTVIVIHTVKGFGIVTSGCFFWGGEGTYFGAFITSQSLSVKVDEMSVLISSSIRYLYSQCAWHILLETEKLHGLKVISYHLPIYTH